MIYLRPREGPGKIRKCKVAPESFPHTWSLKLSPPCGYWMYEVQLLVVGSIAKATFRVFLFYESYYVEQGESTFPALLRPLSSVKVLVLNELNKCRQRNNKTATLMRPFFSVNFHVPSKVGGSSVGSSTFAECIRPCSSVTSLV